MTDLMLCPLCKKANAFYIHKGVWKCKRQEGGCGKIFKADKTTVSIPVSNTKEITCIACGAKRQVQPQDFFQVKRCVPCQKKFRGQSRRRPKPPGAYIMPGVRLPTDWDA